MVVATRVMMRALQAQRTTVRMRHSTARAMQWHAVGHCLEGVRVVDLIVGDSDVLRHFVERLKKPVFSPNYLSRVNFPG